VGSTRSKRSSCTSVDEVRIGAERLGHSFDRALRSLARILNVCPPGFARSPVASRCLASRGRVRLRRCWYGVCRLNFFFALGVCCKLLTSTSASRRCSIEMQVVALNSIFSSLQRFSMTISGHISAFRDASLIAYEGATLLNGFDPV